MGSARLSTFVFSIVLGVSATVSAQGFGQASVGFTVPIGSGLVVPIAAGGETSSRGVSAGGELGVLLAQYPATYFSASVSNHVGTDSGAGDGPFVRGGATFVMQREVPMLFILAGGYDRWSDAHIGWRFEVQDQFTPYSAMPVWLSVRMAVLFR
jgi:hypothetical protein